MGTISSAFSLISQALDAEQAGLSIVANNVANANTTGYTKEVPNWQENQPIGINGNLYGAGVIQTGPTSVRDRILLERLNQQQQLASASGSRLTALDSLQALFTPASGASGSTAGNIGSDLTGFFGSFSSLEANPTNNALRQNVLSAASTLAGDVSNAAASLNSQRAALDQEVGGVTGQVNSLTAVIAQLNLQIQAAAPNADAGTLEDQRQQDIAQLSKLVGINQVMTENNGVSITTTSGQLLVSEGTSVQMTTGSVGGMTHFFLGTGDVTAQLATGGGSLGGLLTARDTDIPKALSSLDQLAYSVSSSVNAVNNAGIDLNGVSGTAFNPLIIFNEPASGAVAGSALNMRVVMTDPNQIAAAGAGQGTGDNSNAVAMASLATGSLIKPSSTTAFSMTQNLDASTPLNGKVSGQIQVFDSLGKSYTAAVTYTNTASNTWSYSVSMPDVITPNTSVANQVSFSFGAGETVNPGTNLTITGNTGLGTATIVAPPVASGEAVGTAGPPATGYLAALNGALATAGIVGVTVTNTGGALTITGATGTAGSLIADPAASANSSGTLQFDGSGNLVSPATNVTGMTFAGLSDGAPALNLDWNLFDANGNGVITQTAAASSQLAQSQNGFAGGSPGQTPINYYSNFVTTLGATVSGVQTDNAAQSASVTQLETQNSALSSVNLNDEASSMTTLERSYQAASQVFAMLNTIMASALNLGMQTTVT